MSMRAPVFAILLAVAISAPAGGGSPPPARPETVADSLYEARAVDSLLAYATREIARARAAGDSVHLGRMTYHRGRARLALGDPGAEGDFDRAVAVAEAAGDSLGRMHALGLKAFVAVNAGRIDESIALNEARNRLALALHQRGSEAWGRLLIGYACLYRDDRPENLARARAEYEEAWRAFGDVNRPGLQLSALVGLGRVFERMGRYDDARTSFQHAWLTARELDDPAQEADAINNLGVLEHQHGELALAARYYDRAYHLKRGAKAFDTVAIARNVAMVDLIIGRYAHAESTLAEALASGPGMGLLDPTAQIELGRLRMAQGRLSGATPLFRRVIARTDRVALRSRVEAATSLGEALARLDSLPAALQLMDDTFAPLAAQAPSVWRAEAYIGWAQRLRESTQYARAGETAGRAWDDAIARHDSTLALVAAAEVSRALRAQGRRGEARAWLERARGLFEAAPRPGEFQWREAQRAVLARALIAAGDVLRDDPPEASRAARDRALFDFLQQVQSRTLLERITDPRRVGDIDAALARPVSADELQRSLLAPGECYFDATVGEGKLYLFAITRDSLRAVVKDDIDGALERRVRHYARLVSRAPGERGAPAPDAAARALGDEFFAAFALLHRGVTRVYVTLDGYLAGLPVETLVCPGEETALFAAREVVRVPSAAMLRFLRARPAGAPRPGSLVAVGSAARDLPGAAREVKRLRARHGATALIAPARETFLDALAGRDVIHLASHVRVDGERPWHSGVLVEAVDATAIADAERTRGTDTADPLSLSPADSSAIAAALPRDPYVRASEIAARRLDARLVVLSGCESALGRATLAEGVLGVASAFVSAGARAVVASLWEVDDRTTESLMADFYRELAGGRTAVAALRAAQERTRRLRPHPFFWAGFVVIGDGDVAVDIPAGSAVPRTAVAAAVVAISALLIAGWAIRRRRATIAA